MTQPATAAGANPISGAGTLAPLYSVAAIRAAESAAQAGLAPHALMARAAAAAAQCALQLLAGGPDRPRVLLAVGPGNNGGDALDCAALLGERCDVTVLLPQAPRMPTGAPPSRPHRASDDHAAAWAKVTAADSRVVVLTGPQALEQVTARSWDLLIDGLFGIGLSRALGQPWAETIRALNALAVAQAFPVLALDVPSGLDADTGMVQPDSTGAAGACIRATHTVTFIGDKTGLHTGHGREQAGEVIVATLGIDRTCLPPPVAWRNAPDAFPAIRLPRRQDSHKGTWGDVHVIGGGAGMTGAAILAAQAALKSGCGRVTIGFAQDEAAPAFIPGQPELMCRTAAMLAVTDAATATRVVGPGLGRDPMAASLVEQACQAAGPLVLDADALNLIATCASLAARLPARAGATILTPHPLEAARLLGLSVAAVQADRLAAATTLARRHRATVVLKGSGSIVTDGEIVLINPTGNAALATGGTGDVLAGICGALLAQGWTALAAAAGAVWLHGAAADHLAAQGIGPIGMTAGELIDAVRLLRNRLTARRITLRVAGHGQDDVSPWAPGAPP